MKIVQLNLVIFLMTLTVSAIAQHDYDNQGVIYSNNGNVGIGTNAPSSLFHLNGWGELLRLSSPNNSIGMTTSLSTTPNGNSNNETVNRILFQALPDNISSVSRVFHFRGHHGSVFTPLFEIESTHDGNIMRLSSNTNHHSRTLVEVDNQDGSVFIIKGDGKVGIGKSPGSSSAFLDVQGTINSDVGYHIDGSRILTIPTQKQSIFLGNYVGENNTSGNHNVFMGWGAGRYNTTGKSNTFVGANSGVNNTTANGNTFFGNGSGRDNTTGFGNTYIGSGAGRDNTIGSENLYIGQYAGLLQSSGSQNTFLGKSAGQNNIDGSYNVFVGHQAGYNETGSNKLYIENSSAATPLIYGEFDQDKVGINTTNLAGNYSLFVKNGIRTEKVVVELETEWGDYVFESDYKLPSLTEVANYIQQHQHLPEIPSAKEIEKDGLNLGEMEALMMKKIEELTLYAIEQERKVEKLEKENEELKEGKEKLEARSEQLAINNEQLEVRVGQMESEKDELKQKNQVLTERLDKLEEILETLLNK